MAKFRCDCFSHLLEIGYDKNIDMLFLLIYNLYSVNGKKLKKPKLLGDVVIADNAYPKELTKMFNYLEGIVVARRRKQRLEKLNKRRKKHKRKKNRKHIKSHKK